MIMLLAHWRLALFVALGAALAIQTARLEWLEHALDHFRLEVEAEGREAKAMAEAMDAHHQLINEELEHDIHTEREERRRERAARGVSSDRFAALYRRYHGLLNDPGVSGVPEAGRGAAEPVQPICLDRGRLIAGLQRDLDALSAARAGNLVQLHGELAGVAERGTDALNDVAFWGKWARLVGACQNQKIEARP